MHSTTAFPFRIPSLFTALLALSACGPCDDVIVLPGDAPICIPDDSGRDVDGGGGDESGAPDVCEPTPGQPWGSCVGGECEVVGGIQSVCSGSEFGTICLPVCIGNECDGLGGGGCSDECGGDDVYETCIVPCIDDETCPNPGMVCTGSMCTWPSAGGEPTACDVIDVPGQAFGPCLADYACDAPGTFCAGDVLGRVCVPSTFDTCAEQFADCSGPEGFTKGYGAQVDACLFACVDSDDCPAGMVCGEDFNMCVWPL